MERIRLLQVIPTLRCGGAERMVVNLMTHLDKRRFHIGAVILAGAEGGVLEQSVLEAGLQVWHLGKGPGFDPTIPFRIRNIVCQFRPHVVHSHLCLHYAFPALLGCRYAHHVTTVHLPGDTQYARVMLPLTRLAVRRGVSTVAVSGEVAEWVKRLCRVPDCLMIPNGIPVPDYQRCSAARMAWRREHGLREKDVAFVCVARLEKQKNHAMLLEAFGRTLGSEPHAQLLLVGDGGCRKALERLVRELQLEGKVRFLGQRADVPQILGAADVFVLSSQNEGNPLALMEAMASGLPVVATAVGGVPELIVDQKSGLLAMPDDCEGLASSMLRLFRDADMRRTMGGCAAEQALQSFSAARMAHTHMELYERILAGRASIDEDCRIEMAAHYPN